MKTSIKILLSGVCFSLGIQKSISQVPPQSDLRMYDIVSGISSARIESDIRTLAGFGTRNTLSDTVSEVRGIGAARRWIKSEFERISAECGNCLEVSYNRGLVKRRR